MPPRRRGAPRWNVAAGADVESAEAARSAESRSAGDAGGDERGGAERNARPPENGSGPRCWRTEGRRNSLNRPPTTAINRGTGPSQSLAPRGGSHAQEYDPGGSHHTRLRRPAPEGGAIAVARIRTIKPEITQSLSLAEVSLTAERTFVCLLTQVDDEGRHIDHAAIINGVLWALRPEHTPVHCADDLQQLASVGLLCRYTGCDGRQYLHVAKWHEHQKISHPSASRLPSCPVHEHGRRCGKCKGERCARPAPEDLGRVPETVPGPVLAPVGDSTLPEAAPQTVSRPESGHQTADADEAAGQGTSPESLRRAQEDLVPGSRILDPGSTPKGAAPPRPPRHPRASLTRTSRTTLRGRQPMTA